MSWFKTLETKNELIVSKKFLDKYMSNNSSTIGSTKLEKITKLIQQILTHQHELLHCYFKSKCTFDFIGDSIVEGMNYPLKQGPLGVSSRNDISSSGYTQLKSCVEKTQKSNLESASKLNSIKTWSQSKLCWSSNLSAWIMHTPSKP